MPDSHSTLAASIANAMSLTQAMASVLLLHGGTDAERVAGTAYIVIATHLAAHGVDVTTINDRAVSRLMGEVADVIEMAAARIKAEAN